jgi:hypothetical protein
VFASDLVDAHPTAIALTPSSPLPQLGSMGGGEFEPLQCPPGSVLGAAGIATGLIFATSVGASCRPLDVSGLGASQQVVLGPSEPLPPVLAGQRLEAIVECPVGEIAVGLHGRENDLRLTGAGLRCRPVALAYP